MGLCIAVVSLLILLIGTLPFFIFIYTDIVLIGKIAFFILTIVLWIFAYLMFTPTIRHINNCRLGRPLAVFTRSGIRGYTPLVKPISIKWEQINEGEVQSGLGNIVLWDKNQIDSAFLKYIRDIAPVWTPKSVSIPLAFGREKFESVMQAYDDINPYGGG